MDMMFAEMIRIGSHPPLIEKLPDPAVRIVLYGQRADELWYRFFVSLAPRSGMDDVDAALVVWRGAREPYLTGRSCANLLQRSESDAEEALCRVAAHTFGFQAARTARTPDTAETPPVEKASVLDSMKVPPSTAPAWRLSRQARSALALARISGSTESTLAWARERGRISSSEYCEMTGVSGATAVKRLKELADEGLVTPSSESGRGRGFHYLPV